MSSLYSFTSKRAVSLNPYLDNPVNGYACPTGMALHYDDVPINGTVRMQCCSKAIHIYNVRQHLVAKLKNICLCTYVCIGICICVHRHMYICLDISNKYCRNIYNSGKSSSNSIIGSKYRSSTISSNNSFLFLQLFVVVLLVVVVVVLVGIVVVLVAVQKFQKYQQHQ